MKVMLSAGEVSGDVHGSYLVKELKKIRPDLFFFGMGSEKMQAEGVDIRIDIASYGTIGILEALARLLPVYLVYRKMVALLKKERPALLILIDSQGINMPLAQAAKKLGIKTVYYIAPQEWLWGTEKGVKKVASTIDLILSIFEKEQAAYKQAGANSFYFGHPLIDIVKAEKAPSLLRQEFLGSGNGPVIALCPGSRRQEIKSLLPILLAAGELIQKALPQARFILPAASNDMLKMIFGYIKDFRPLSVVGRTYDVLACADLALCTSGTINLEASLLNAPNIMIYKLSLLSYFIGKYIFKMEKKMPYFSMPNLLLNEKAIPEFIMWDAYPQPIAKEALSILKDPLRQQKMREQFTRLRHQLGQPGAISRCVQKIAELLD